MIKTMPPPGERLKKPSSHGVRRPADLGSSMGARFSSSANRPLRLLLLLAVIWLAGCDAWTQEDRPTAPAAQRIVGNHFDELEQSAPFRLAPPSATLTTKGRRDSCLDPHFDRDEPAVWLRYSFEGDAAEMLAFYRSRLISDGWAELPYNPSVLGRTKGMRFSKELTGWRATVDVDVAPVARTIDVTASDSSVHVCPS
jgi:hypothetical protein